MSNYADGSYWDSRKDMLYYRYLDYIVRCIAADADSMIDVGSGNSPYIDWFYWIDRRVSLDIRSPYQSEKVIGIKGDIFKYKIDQKFDLCTCLQVLEHVDDPKQFLRRLFDFSSLVLVSVPYMWPEGKTRGHLQDPVDERKLIEWAGRIPNYIQIVDEPFETTKARRLFAIFDTADQSRLFDSSVKTNRRNPL